MAADTPNGKKISELVEEWGISRQSVMHRLETVVPDRSEWIKVGKTYLVTPDQEAQMVARFGVPSAGSHPQTSADPEESPADTNVQEIDDMRRQIEQLQANLQEKNKRIQELESYTSDLKEDKKAQADEIRTKNEQIHDLMASMERVQQSLMAEQALHREALALIPAPKEEAQDAEIVEHEDLTAETQAPPESEKKKGLWRRIFGGAS